MPVHTKAKQNNCQTEEQTKTTSTSSSNISPIVKLEQAQVSHNNRHTSDNSTEGQTADTNSEHTNNSDHSSNCSNHPCNLNFDVSNDSQFMYDPGGNTFNTEDGSAYDNGDSGSSSSSSSNDNMPCNANAYHSFDHNCNKTILTTSDVNLFLPLNSVQITCPINTS
jgi:hypothetical protein